MSSKYSLNLNNEHKFYQVSPTPTREEIALYYQNEFYSPNYKSVNNSSLEYQEKDQAFNYEKREDIASVFQSLLELKELTGLSLFDIGCGWGHFLSHFKAKGMNCVGCEPCEEAANYAQQQGLDVIPCGGIDLDEINIEKKFHIVTLMNVLEHVADPVATIQVIREKYIQDDGILLIEVPNDFNVFQEAAVKINNLDKWWVQPPAHLNYFSKESLSSLVEHFNFEIVHLSSSFPLEMFLLFGDNYVGNPDLGAMCHQKRVKFEESLRRAGYANELRLFYNKLAEINLGRTIQLYARAKR